jgi:Family of unknown function (DUF6481)
MNCSSISRMERSWLGERRLRCVVAAQSAERAILLEAEQKVARDARYAARKAAKKERRRGY